METLELAVELRRAGYGGIAARSMVPSSKQHNTTKTPCAHTSSSTPHSALSSLTCERGASGGGDVDVRVGVTGDPPAAFG